MTKEEFFGAIEAAETTDLESLRALLSHPDLLWALKVLMEEIGMTTEKYSGLDFSTQNGIVQAVRLQGRIDGLIVVIDRLYDLAYEEKEDEDGN